MTNFFIHSTVNGIYDTNYARSTINNIIEKNNIPTTDINELVIRGQGGKHYNLQNYKNQMSSIVEKSTRVIKEKLVLNNLIDKDTNLNFFNMWTALGYENGFHKIHQDQAGTISAIIYLSVASSTFHKSGMFYAVVDNQIIEHTPRNGDCLIFSNGVLHGTYPQDIGLSHTLNISFNLE